MKNVWSLDVLVIGGALATTMAAGAPPAWSASGVFERTWGYDVDAVNPDTGFEVCTVAANCKAGIPSLPGDGFNGPLAIGTGPGGEVYVGDVGFQRVEKFEPDGTFVAAWGEGVVTGSPGTYEICTVPTDCRQGQHTGIGGSFGNTLALATDSQGNVYVAADDRITKFGSDGHFIAVWGKDVDTGGGTGFEICTVSASCKAAATGTLGGELFGAAGIGIDATDRVYVADYSNNRVQKFEANGNWELAWGEDVIQSGKPGDTGTGFEVCTTATDCKAGVPAGLGGKKLGGVLDMPSESLGIDSSGNVYVGDLTSRVQKFGADGHFIAAWGKDVIQSGKPGDTGTGYEVCTVADDCQGGAGSSLGTAGGEFNGVYGVAIDGADRVYANDESHERIQVFDTAGNFIAAWGKDVIQSGKPGDTGGGYEICTVIGDCQAGATGSLGGEMNNPGNIAADADGAVYVADFNNGRVQRFADSPPGTTSTTMAGSTTSTTMLARTTTSTTGSSTTTSTTMPGSPCDALAGLDRARCRSEAALSGGLCDDPVPDSVMHAIDGKLGAVDRLLGRAIDAIGAKQAKLIKKARNRLDAIARNATAAAVARKPKKRITGACASSIEMLVSDIEADLV